LVAASPCFIAQGATEEVTDWPTVITKLRRESHSHPGSRHIREQLAIALNNYGVRLADEGKVELARAQLREAMALAPEDNQFPKNLASIYLNEAHELFQRRQTREAKAAVQEAIALDPALAQAYALLGEIEYNSQQLANAKAAWQRAVALDPEMTELSARLEQVTQELPVESKFERLSQAYFDIRYEEQLERPAGFDIRDALLEARREVGSDFAHWPKYRLVVLVYSAPSFRALRQEVPEWVGGQYDGKIRVPLPDGELDAGMVKQILFHEYTHALVHDLGKGTCPVWFNEGLAEYEGRKHGPQHLDQLVTAIQHQQVVPWEELDGQFSASLSVDQVALGYQQSYSIVRYLVERYGFWRIRRILTAVATGEPLAEVLVREFHVKLDRLRTNWNAWLPTLTK
jgi:tetratricopeptide (TPR) repeat protein